MLLLPWSWAAVVKSAFEIITHKQAKCTFSEDIFVVTCQRKPPYIYIDEGLIYLHNRFFQYAVLETFNFYGKNASFCNLKSSSKKAMYTCCMKQDLKVVIKVAFILCNKTFTYTLGDCVYFFKCCSFFQYLLLTRGDEKFVKFWLKTKTRGT